MEIKTHLLVAENLNNEHSDPHAIGVISVPWNQVDEHPRLQEIRDAMSSKDREQCAKEGVLTLTTDYGFVEEYKDGVGLVMRDVDVKVEKLRPEDKERIGGWVQEQYGMKAGTDAELASALADPQVKDHIVADMTIAGMGKETFMEALEAHKSGGEIPYPLEEQDMERIAGSLAARGADPEKHYDTVAMDMRDRWPSPESKNYGHDEKGEAQVIFFKGFDAAAEVVVKAGAYAKQPAWPSYDNGFDGYDRNGIARDEDGNRIEPKDIPADKDYSYYADKSISQTLSGKDALATIDRWSNAQENSPNYNGMDRNCVGVAGVVVFGDQYKGMVQGLTGKESPEGQLPKVTNAELRQGINEGRALPQGMLASHIEGITPQSVSARDNQGIGAAVEQAERNMGQQAARGISAAPPAPEKGMDNALAAMRNANINLDALGVSHRGATASPQAGAAAAQPQREQSGPLR